MRRIFHALGSAWRPLSKPSHIVIIVLLLLITGFLIYQNSTTIKHPENTLKVPSSNDNRGGTLPRESPTFKTILPTGKTIADFGQWTRVSPKDRAAAYAYADTIAGVSIIVTQQKLPEDFDGDVAEQIDTLAAGYHADQTLNASGTPVHIGSSAKGPQSVIFTKSSLLILIKSSTKIPNEAWITYVNSLE